MRAAYESTIQAPNEAFFTIFDFLEGWYYPHRRHSELCYLSTNNYERRMSNAA